MYSTAWILLIIYAVIPIVPCRGHEPRGGLVRKRVLEYEPRVFEGKKARMSTNDIVHELNRRKRFALVLGDRVDAYDPDFLRDHEALMDELTYHTTGLAKSLEASSRAKAKDKNAKFTDDEMSYTLEKRVPPKLLLERIKAFNKLSKEEQAEQLAPWKAERREKEEAIIERKKKDDTFNGFGNPRKHRVVSAR
ncbi:hypothetical protein Pmar_PMAR018818 [Perkinsus marinus ATCC 50983]|uniref:Uncharacterized protein n=1 Tax=Perkinsus marinus (strain ATCC 50983 / TXsc) TaxID=423536 RepID=C5LVF5_PERM5|nr:hypothetical protein Pmar_PMAR018818 [Perkinsus marinus ATCC 50983]EEQ99283.1 hypothetical protein Pmar_PMAR018818 [Perkinsus marinus ATCC 50983]|eukprot:XP_002766566.1 hypothetical protein Pmar_PMAR018818 [Perkinsus marinus ATCC 50983]